MFMYSLRLFYSLVYLHTNFYESIYTFILLNDERENKKTPFRVGKKWELHEVKLLYNCVI